MAPAETSETNGDPDPETVYEEAKQAVKDQKDLIEAKNDDLKEYVTENEEELERLQKKRDEHQQYLEYYEDDKKLRISFDGVFHYLLVIC